MISLRNAGYSYRDGDPVLRNINLEIPSGLTLLLGPNGCGKSTLLKLIAGVERPDTGSVEIDGRNLWTNEAAARQTLAYVPEQPDLTPYASVKDVLTLVCRLRREPVSTGRAVLEKVGLERLSRRSIRELSMGQRRRVVLAAAWIGSPKTILLDEPLESMDRVIRKDILAWIDRLIAQDGTVVVTTHELEPFVEKALRVVTIQPERCRIHSALPIQSGEKMQLLDALSRGL
jgi:ABC-type multidrug transport system ATPase subunit